MATINDIDTVAEVRKFLERRTVVSRSQTGDDQADEIQAVLEAVAITFLLEPSAALWMVVFAKNQLQQVVTKDLETIDYILATFKDLPNPDTTVDDVSDLIEAQTALVELDRLGNFQEGTKAFNRYNQAVDRFLNERLAPSLKRKQNNSFNRTGKESRQDLFSALQLFSATHQTTIVQLNAVARSVPDFQSVDLNRIVSRTTVGRVRNSLKKVQRGFEKDNISKTAAAIELLSGAAALKSISNSRGVYDPLVETGSFPKSRNILATSEDTATPPLTSTTPPWQVVNPVAVCLSLDELDPLTSITVSVEIPAPDRSGDTFIVAESIPDPVPLPAGPKKLYIATPGAPGGDVREVDFSALGTSPTYLAVLNILTAALPDLDTQLTPQIEGREGPNRRLMIVGHPGTVPSMTILDHGPNDVDGGGIVTEAVPSIHAELGFAPNQTCNPSGTIVAKDLQIFVGESFDTLVDVAVNEFGSVEIRSKNKRPSGSIQALSTETAALLSTLGTSPEFGFDLDFFLETFPQAIVLEENGQPVDPESLEIFPNSLVTLTDEVIPRDSGSFPVDSLDGNRLVMSFTPRVTKKPVKIVAPVVAAVQDLLSRITPLVGLFDSDLRNIQRVCTPLLSTRSTQSQLGDAKRLLNAIRARLTNNQSSGLLDILKSVTVREDQSPPSQSAKLILSTLDERGMDRASELLKSGKFSEFFSLRRENASKSGHFMNTMENTMRSDFATTTIEREKKDPRPAATLPAHTIATNRPSNG
jgi:hypothetical protein